MGSVDPQLTAPNKTWRKKDGRYIHDGDCWFWDLKVCTCGLLNHLLPRDWAEWVYKEHAEQDHQREALLNLDYALEERNKLVNYLTDIDDLIMQLPGGIDYDADPEDESPDDAVAHIGGMIHKLVGEAVR